MNLNSLAGPMPALDDLVLVGLLVLLFAGALRLEQACRMSIAALALLHLPAALASGGAFARRAGSNGGSP